MDIEIDVGSLRPAHDDGISRSHFAVGKVRYDKVDPQANPGILLYVKASLTESEPVDIQAYKAENERFPHQSTVDQWFSESQFESYRMLGYDSLRSTFDQIKGDVSAYSVKRIAGAIEQLCKKRGS